MNKTINPIYGIGELSFNMDMLTIEKLIGEPSSIDNFEDHRLVYYYNNLGLNIILNLLENQSLIHSFEIEEGDYILWNKLIMYLNYDEIINFLNTEKINYRLDNYYSERYIFCNNLAFEFEKELVSVLTIYNPKLDNQ